MNWKVLAGGLAVLVPLIVVLAMGFGKDPHAVRSPLLGKAAPTFALKAVDTDAVVDPRLGQGKPVVLNFWATWCQPCKAEHGILEWAAQRHGQKVQFFGLVYEDTKVRIQAFLKQHGSGYPTLVDVGGKTAIAYGVGGVPETFFIDAKGVIREKYAGPLSAPMIEERIQRLMAEAP